MDFMRVAKRKSSQSPGFPSMPAVGVLGWEAGLSFGARGFLVNYLLGGLGLVEFALDAGQEGPGGRRRRNSAFKQLAVVVFLAVEGPDRLRIGTNIYATQVHANIGSLGARIGQDASVQL